MKKFFYPFVIVAAAAMTLVSCNEEIENPAQEEIKATHTVKFTSAIDTKTAMTEGAEEATFEWTSIDENNFKVYENGVEGEAIGSQNTDGKMVILAEFPTPDTTPESYTYTATLNGVVGNQVLTVGQYDENADVLVAKAIVQNSAISATDDILFQFKRVIALNKVTFSGFGTDDTKITKVVISSENAKLAGAYDVNAETPGWASEGTNEITLTPAANTDFAISNPVYFNCIPTEGAKITFTVTTDKGTYSRTAKSLALNENQLNTYAIPLKAAPCAVENFTATVEDTEYGSSKSFKTASNISTYDYTWTLVEESTATVGHDFIKLGKSGTAGSIQNTTMLADLDVNCVFTIKVYAANWPTKTTDLYVNYNGKRQSIALDNAPSSSDNDYDATDFREYDFIFQKADNADGFIIGGNTERVLIDKIEVVKGGELPAEPMAFGVSTTSIATGWDETSATFDIIADNVVNWEIVADDGLTLSQDEGSGNATITVTFDQNEGEEQIRKEIVVATEYSPVIDEDEYTISFIQNGKPARDMDGEGTVESPYSSADALYIINHLDDGGKTNEEVYVGGYIVNYEPGIETKYGNATFGIADSKTEDEVIKAYRIKDFKEASFTSSDQLSLGDYVVIKAKLYKYVKDSNVTPETDGGEIYSINGATSILTGITLSEKVTTFFTGDTFIKAKVTAKYRGKDDTVVTDDTQFTGYNMSEIGEYEVTASYTENDIIKTESYTIFVNDGTAYTLTPSFDSSKGNVTISVDGGTAVSTATTAKAGQTVTVQVTPGDDYICSSIAVNNVPQEFSGNNTLKFTMPASAVTVTVTFVEKPEGLTISQTSFSTVSGNLSDDANISYAATKGNGTTTPVINSNRIRLYKPSSGNSTGGILTLTANNGAKITSVTVVSNRNNGFNIAVDGSAYPDITGTTTYEVTDINASEVTFTNKYSDSNDISSITVTYYGGIKPEPEQLEMTTVAVDTKTSSSIKFKWDAVDHATGYKVKVGASGTYGDTQTGTTYTVSDLDPETSITIYVYAVGNGDLYLDSEPVSCEATTAAAGGGSTVVEKTLIIDGTPLTSTATTESTDYTFGNITVTMSDGAKVQSSTGDKKFSSSAILIGKSGKYIYNKTAIPGKITKFEIYANKGASAKVSVGVSFSDNAISSYSTGNNTYTATLSTLDEVYDCSSKLTANCQYFWYQVTNANNSQVQFRITYETTE